MRRLFALFAAALFIAAPALAQTSDDAEPKAKEPPAKHKTDIDTLVGRTLRLLGSTGALQVRKGAKRKELTIVKLVLSGEVISDPTQKCEISIVSESPIATTLTLDVAKAPQYAVDIPACPFAFMVLNEAMLVWPRGACVFKAADCQANPNGLWGPTADELADQANQIAKDRDRVDASVAASVMALGKRDKDAAAQIEKAEAAFEAGREVTCGKYDGEATYGFCRSRIDEAHALALKKRVADSKKADEKKPKDTTSAD